MSEETFSTDNITSTLMTEIEEYKNSPHVKSFPDYPGIDAPFQLLDYTLGFLLIFCSIIGVLGNVCGALYFTSTKRDRVTLIYIIICCVDSVTSIIHLPVTMSLFVDRKPGMFQFHLFCVLWEVVYNVLQKMSIFLVLLLSTSRTIAIVFPFYNMRTRTILGSVAGYFVILFLIPLLQHVIVPLRGEYKYSWEGAYCYYNFRMKFEHVVNLIMVGLPPIVTFVTLITSIAKLHYSDKSSASKSDNSSPRTKRREKKKRQASITIVMFTTLFLICNIPLFINLMQNMIAKFFGVGYPGVYFGTRFMFWYSWHIAKIESVVVNAVLNPVFYFYRMNRFRMWCWSLILPQNPLEKDPYQDSFRPSVTMPRSPRVVVNAVRVQKYLAVNNNCDKLSVRSLEM